MQDREGEPGHRQQGVNLTLITHTYMQTQLSYLQHINTRTHLYSLYGETQDKLFHLFKTHNGGG